MKAIEVEKKIGELNHQRKAMEKELTLAQEEEALELLKEREIRLKKEVEEALGVGKESKKLEEELLDVSQKVLTQMKKVASLKSRQAEAEALRLERMARIRQACETLASQLTPRAESLDKEIREVCKKLWCLSVIHYQNIPWELEQTSSREIKVQKKILRPTWVLGDSIMEEGIEERFIQIHKLPRLLENGWEVSPNQNLEPDPPTPGNSIRVKSLPTPESIRRIDNLDIDRSYFMGITEQDLLGFEKEIAAFNES